MKQPEEAFVFPPELGKRLRELRRHAGLTQAELARLMGRTGRKAGNLVGRLELGRSKHPTLSLIADYLRACRAGFKDIDDILSRYTSQARVVEHKGTEAVRNLTRLMPDKVSRSVSGYDRKRTAKRTQQSAEQRVERVRRMFGNRYRKQMLETRMFDELKKPGQNLEQRFRAEACEHGRKIFSIMLRTRGKDIRRLRQFRKEKERAEQTKAPKQALAAMASAAEAVYEWLEKNGRLDWMPSAAELGNAAETTRVFQAVKAEVRLAGEEQQLVAGYAKKRMNARAMVWLDVNRVLEAEGMSHEWRAKYFQPWIERLFEVVMATEPGPERDQQVEQVLTRQKFKDRVQEMAPQILDRCEAWKKHLGRPPPGWRP